MLRRRKKDQRDAKRPPRAHPASVRDPPASAGRRRARTDAPVPAELRIPERTTPTPISQPAKSTPTPISVVLVTGFDPFGGERLNPSWEICRLLAGRTIAGRRIEACKVPCEFRASVDAVAKAIDKHRPGLVICLGQAGGRAHLSVERVAINVDDARIADNAGTRPVDEPIERDGPPAYFATVPVKAMTQAMRAAGVPAQVSNSAGTYVCNHVMYGVLHFLATRNNVARAGFIHVPYAEAQVLDKPAMPALSIATMVRGVEAAIEAAINNATDLKVSEGALD